ncbi:hypothetical protein DIPPA_54940 [Diplonema papillatum]|nr:hypothetical protein DIPPA_54940 [Diplonema papillatum]
MLVGGSVDRLQGKWTSRNDRYIYAVTDLNVLCETTGGKGAIDADGSLMGSRITFVDENMIEWSDGDTWHRVGCLRQTRVPPSTIKYSSEIHSSASQYPLKDWPFGSSPGGPGLRSRRDQPDLPASGVTVRRTPRNSPHRSPGNTPSEPPVSATTVNVTKQYTQSAAPPATPPTDYRSRASMVKSGDLATASSTRTCSPVAQLRGVRTDYSNTMTSHTAPSPAAEDRKQQLHQLAHERALAVEAIRQQNDNLARIDRCIATLINAHVV